MLMAHYIRLCGFSNEAKRWTSACDTFSKSVCSWNFNRLKVLTERESESENIHTNNLCNDYGIEYSRHCIWQNVLLWLLWRKKKKNKKKLIWNPPQFYFTVNYLRKLFVKSKAIKSSSSSCTVNRIGCCRGNQFICVQ